MNIMFGDSINDEVRSKYIILELDTFYFADISTSRIAYGLVEQTPIMEMVNVDRFIDLHANLIRNYGLKNWKYCEDALEHLVGKWNGEMDTFYSSLAERIAVFKEKADANWSPVINRP